MVANWQYTLYSNRLGALEKRMNRRTVMMSALAGQAVLVAQGSKGKLPIELHTDLHVKLEEEEQLIKDFHALYLPRIQKAPGYVDARLLKFDSATIGKAPEFYNYRLVQVFETEELRDKWTVHPDHKIAWHTALEAHVKTPFIAYRYKTAAKAKK